MIYFRNTLNKVVETADIVSHLIKNTKSSSAKIKKSVHYSSSSNGANNTATLLNSINTPKTTKSFKAGGIVAAAVQNKRFLKKSSQHLLPQNSPTKAISEMNLNSPNTDSEPENLKINSVHLKSKHKHRSHKLHKGSKENSKKTTKSSP